ncbi:MAG: S1 family peptidase [Kofleriaceae bacterium]|nr:S1 family peptidase [Kofleriaceae bacterium]
MKIFAALGALVFGACAVDPDATSTGTVEQFLTSAAPTSSYGAVAFIRNEDSNTSCSGVLISDRTVLTAGHCLNRSIHDTTINYAPVSSIDVYFAADMTTLTGKRRYDAAARIIHSGFGGGATNDLGIIRLTESVAGVAPIAVLSQQPAVGDMLTVLGYGVGTNFGRRQVGHNLINTIIGRVFGFEPADGTSACAGDSGGPSLVERGGQQYVAGIHSSGTCGDSTSYDMRTDFYVAWIRDNAYRSDGDSGGTGGGTVDVDVGDSGGCSAGGGEPRALGVIALGLAGVLMRRRRRPRMHCM